MLLQNTNELTSTMNNFNERINETKRMYNEKLSSFKNIVYNYEKKIDDYKEKIELLKQKINELVSENENLRFNQTNSFYNSGTTDNFKIKKIKSMENLDVYRGGSTSYLSDVNSNIYNPWYSTNRIGMYNSGGNIL